MQQPSPLSSSGQRSALDYLNDFFAEDEGDAPLFVTPEPESLPVVSTGSLGLDVALGVGGLTRGSVAEIFGSDDSGKTTLALRTIANGQAAGLTCAFIDVDSALDPAYAALLGVNLSTLLLSQPANGPQALALIEELTASSAVDIIVVDSVAALEPEISARPSSRGQPDPHIAMMGAALRRLAPLAEQTGTLLLFLNQIRHAPGGRGRRIQTTTGGTPLKFYAAVRVEVHSQRQVLKNDQAIGKVARVRVVKNSFAPAFRSADFEILSGQGVNAVGELLSLGLRAGLVRSEGSALFFGPTALGRGVVAATAALAADHALAQRLESEIRAQAAEISPQSPQTPVRQG